jgi:AcrR family transcriptional regulator
MLMAYNKWIETGYNLFAHQGIDCVNIERLAKTLGLNKSGFYHYFQDRDSFLEQLMLHHTDMADLIIRDLRSVKQFDPGFI